jgi:hypothetical protein
VRLSTPLLEPNTNVHDTAALLARFATKASFSADAHGGAPFNPALLDSTRYPHRQCRRNDATELCSC